MKTNLKSNSILLGGLLLLGTVFSCTQAEQDYASYVNPFIGTGGHGHTYPGAVVPNGMIQPSPDTRIYEWDACSGYYYEDTTINGFSHTHVSGTGCADYGDVLLMPTVGKQEYRPVYQLLCQVLQAVYLYIGDGFCGIGRRRSAFAHR